jgi:ABC-type transport system involved in cytochrome c biogenesis permease subunit
MAASLKSWWLYIHIIFAMMSYGAFFVAMAAAILYLMKNRAESGKAGMTPLLSRIPKLAELDELILKNVIYGFIAYAGMIASGAFWGKNLWGSYWRWDPVETWSLISWMIYGIILHLRVTLGWRGVRFCWLVIIAIPTVLLVFWGVNFAVESSLHIFNVR